MTLTFPHPFVGRQREMALLERLWQSPQAAFLVLYGRRRIGKTRLLWEWTHRHADQVLYWAAEPSSVSDQRRAFSQAVYRFFHPQGGEAALWFPTWRAAFQAFAEMAAQRGRRVALIIDEFTYLLEHGPTVAGALQNAWDQTLSRGNLLLALSGSHMGMVVRDVLSPQAPLYGRATAALHLPPLPYPATREAFPTYPPEARVALYAVVGGVPAYWAYWDPQAAFQDNLKAFVLHAALSLGDEPRFLLQDYIRETGNYYAILNAIARGAHTPAAIRRASGLPSGHVSRYLELLLDTGYVERRRSLTAAPHSRQGRYHLTDPFLRFYFRFISPYRGQIAAGVQEPLWEELRRHLLDFIGLYTWEEIARLWTLHAGARGALPFHPLQVGAAWNRQAQVDVVGINPREGTLILGECKWSPEATPPAVLSRLVARTDALLPAEKHWRVHYVLFSRGGWTPETARLAEQLRTTPLRGERWQTAGVTLVDLATVDEQLWRWHREPPPESTAIPF